MSKLFDKLQVGLNEIKAFEDGELSDINVRVSTRSLKIKPVPKTIPASKIKSIRIRMGLSQSQFAEVLGVSTITVSKWEQGTNSPQPSSIRLLNILSEKPSLLTELDIVGLQESVHG